jgi:hypothetical protein
MQMQLGYMLYRLAVKGKREPLLLSPVVCGLSGSALNI